MEVDPWEDELAPRLSTLLANLTRRGTSGGVDGDFGLGSDADGEPEYRVSSDYLLTNVLGLPKERQFPAHTKRLASIMRNLGWSRPSTVLRFGKHVKRGFTKPCKQGV